MLSQTNDGSKNGQQEEKRCVSHGSYVETTKQTIASIDRLLSMLTVDTVKNSPENKETKDTENILVEDVTKELELLKFSFLQTEADYEKVKLMHMQELEKQKDFYEKRLKEMQVQLDDTILLLEKEKETNKKMNVVVDEYEKSISRIIAQSETDRATFKREKEQLQEELKVSNNHLSNTEAAFNDVHQKYERIKCVVQVYKNNESVLKESIQENEKTIKALDNRYETLKGHAMEQLEKANIELASMQKQHEAEAVKLRAILAKTELKSNSLAELVEQKTKENKELMKILDEIIARVGPKQ